MKYAQCDNVAFLHNLLSRLRGKDQEKKIDYEDDDEDEKE